MRIYVFLSYKIKMINNLILTMEYLLLTIGLIIVIVLYKKHNDNDYFNEN
jgi:hypothetical protein